MGQKEGDPEEEPRACALPRASGSDPRVRGPESAQPTPPGGARRIRFPQPPP